MEGLLGGGGRRGRNSCLISCVGETPAGEIYGFFPKKHHIYIYICTCMVSTSSRVWINRVRKITNPARDQLGQEKWILSCLRSHLRIWSRKTSSAVPSRVSPLILHTQTKFGAYLRDYSRASHDDGVHTYRLPSSTAVGSVPIIVQFIGVK